MNSKPKIAQKSCDWVRMCSNNQTPYTTTTQPDGHDMLCSEGRVSLYSFLITAALVLLPSVPQIYYGIVPNAWGAVLWGPLLYYFLVNLIIRFVLRNTDYQVPMEWLIVDKMVGVYVLNMFPIQVAIRASFLGFVEAVSVLVICFAPTLWKQFGVYGCFMAFFHYSEFLVIAWANPRTLSLDSFMLNHSVHYGLAAAASWTEFLLEIYLLPEFKGYANIWLLGVVLCTCGEVIRKVAIVTAGRSFTHLVSHAILLIYWYKVDNFYSFLYLCRFKIKSTRSTN